MLKLNNDITPAGTINGINKVFTLPEFIGYIQDVIIDGVDVGGAYTFLHDKVTVTSAPSSTITITYFSREERDILGNGEVTMGDLIDGLYDEIGRKNVSKVYGKDRVRREFNETIGMLLDDTPERSSIQHYSFKGLNGLQVTAEGHTVDLTKPATYALPIEGSFLVGKGLYYNYFDYDGQTFTVSGADLIDAGDRMIIGHRIPTGVERISTVYVNGIELEYIDNREFYMDTAGFFTTIKDYEGNEYLYLPYSNKTYSCVVKFIPDYAIATIDEDVLNVPYKYKRTFIYDVAYRMLASREDDRWQYYEKEAIKSLKKYKAFKAKGVNKTKTKIGFANTFGERNMRRVSEILPEGVYDGL